MASPKMKAKRLVRRLRLFQEDANKLSKKIGSLDEVTCTRGCHHCCYQMVALTLPEAVAMLDKSGDRWWRENQAEIESRAMLWLSNTMDRRKWMGSKRPCIFLKDGECSVYRVRPFACATYAVVTDPDLCSPDNPGSQVGIVDVDDAANKYAMYSVAIGESVGLPRGIFPLSIGLVLAKEYIERGSDAVIDKVREMGLDPEYLVQQMKTIVYRPAPRGEGEEGGQE
jgi:Fe-S-cluster containining protein